MKPDERNDGITTISKIQGHIGDAVDEFINDYLAANPKR